MRHFIFTLFIFTGIQIVFSSSFSEEYRKALISERDGLVNDAVSHYNRAVLSAPNRLMKEQIQLKIARLTDNYDVKVNLYNKFLNDNPETRYKFLVMYELGALYYLRNDFVKAIETFNLLASQAHGTPYFIKSNLFIASIFLESNNPESAIAVIYKVLENVEDYEETAECYYLAGKAFHARGKVREAIEYFLICAGNFSDSYMGRGALLELVRLFTSTNDHVSASVYAGILALKFPGSFEHSEALKVVKNINEKDAASASEGLISFTLDEDRKTSILEAIRSEIAETVGINDVLEGDKYFVKPGLYIQLGHFSTEENAKRSFDSLSGRVSNIAIYRGMGNGSYFYKVVAGSFANRAEANQAVIRLKDMNIDSFIIEIAGSYE